MFIEIRKRGENKKYYLVHSYREKGKVKRISRYLGSNLNEKKLIELRKRAEWHILSKIKELLSGKEGPKDTDDFETINVAKAIEFIRNSNRKITVDFINNLHLICFKGTKNFAGKLRRV